MGISDFVAETCEGIYMEAENPDQKFQHLKIILWKSIKSFYFCECRNPGRLFTEFSSPFPLLLRKSPKKKKKID